MTPLNQMARLALAAGALAIQEIAEAEQAERDLYRALAPSPQAPDPQVAQIRAERAARKAEQWARQKKGAR